MRRLQATYKKSKVAKRKYVGGEDQRKKNKTKLSLKATQTPSTGNRMQHGYRILDKKSKQVRKKTNKLSSTT